jgi:hypothetical protein
LDSSSGDSLSDRTATGTPPLARASLNEEWSYLEDKPDGDAILASEKNGPDGLVTSSRQGYIYWKIAFPPPSHLHPRGMSFERKMSESKRDKETKWKTKKRDNIKIVFKKANIYIQKRSKQGIDE